MAIECVRSAACSDDRHLSYARMSYSTLQVSFAASSQIRLSGTFSDS
jgi:hypothetical protein